MFDHSFLYDIILLFDIKKNHYIKFSEFIQYNLM